MPNSCPRMELVPGALTGGKVFLSGKRSAFKNIGQNKQNETRWTLVPDQLRVEAPSDRFAVFDVRLVAQFRDKAQNGLERTASAWRIRGGVEHLEGDLYRLWRAL